MTGLKCVRADWSNGKLEEVPDSEFVLPADLILLAMGFLFAHPQVDTAIVGTSNSSHMRANIVQVTTQLLISTEVVEELRRRFDEEGDQWVQKS